MEIKVLITENVEFLSPSQKLPHVNIKPICLHEGNGRRIVKITPTWNVLQTFSRNFPPAKITTFTVLSLVRTALPEWSIYVIIYKPNNISIDFRIIWFFLMSSIHLMLAYFLWTFGPKRLIGNPVHSYKDPVSKIRKPYDNNFVCLSVRPSV